MTQVTSAVVGRALKARFVSLGFRSKCSGFVFMKNMESDSSACLGLGRHKYRDGPIVVIPVVGVRFESIYSLGRRFGCYPESDTNATLSVSMEDLMPEARRHDYEFLDSPDLESEIDRLAADFDEFGIPFIRSIATVDTAAARVRAGIAPLLRGRHEFLPLSRQLAGDLPGALDVARANLTKMDSSRGNGKDYADYVAKLAALCSVVADPVNRTD